MQLACLFLSCPRESKHVVDRRSSYVDCDSSYQKNDGQHRKTTNKPEERRTDWMKEVEKKNKGEEKTDWMEEVGKK